VKKEFDINDILDAVDNIAQFKKKDKKKQEIEKNYVSNNDNMTIKKQNKINKSDVLVLSEMIE
jgi:hypothetical protein|tara:strand:+ start:4021 stop:4209 length:189 start_codon:yes stop_codon:yes gene_type:complete